MQRVSFDRVDFFLGATTPAGFKGYFEPLRREPGMQMVLIKSGPGCGKSTIGRALAKTLGKTYVDLDEVIEKNTGIPIPDIFAREGEASFRKYESQAVAEISKQTRQVIACGGGVINTPGNARALCCGCSARANGWQPAGGRFPPGWTPCARWKPSGCRFTAQRPMPRWITPAAGKTQ